MSKLSLMDKLKVFIDVSKSSSLYLIILVLIEVFTYCNICAPNQSINYSNNKKRRDSGVVKEEIRTQKNIKKADNTISNISEEEEIDTGNNQERLIIKDENSQEG